MHKSGPEGTPTHRAARRRLGRPAVVAAMSGGLVLGLLGGTAAAAAPTARSQNPYAVNSVPSYFNPVIPYRVLDTRDGGGPIGRDSVRSVQVGGVGGVPITATAVVLNVTVTDPTADSFFSVYPAGGVQPLVSNLNFVRGETVAAQVTVPLGVGANVGQIRVYNHAGSADALVDVQGYYTRTGPVAASVSSGLYNPVVPRRAFGGADGAAVRAGFPQAVTVAGGASGVPANAVAVVANLTVSGPSTASYLTAYPAGLLPPGVSNLNWRKGMTVANRAVIPVGLGGRIDLRNYAGSARVALDIDGYYSAAKGGGSRFVPVTPRRVVDTRVPIPVTARPIRANHSEEFDLETAASGVPAGAAAAVAEVTAVPTTFTKPYPLFAASGHFTVYSAATARPATSDVSWMPGEIAVANATDVPLDRTGHFDVYNAKGRAANVLVGVFGYFTAPTPAG